MGLTKKLFTIGLITGSTLGALSLYNKLIETMAGELGTVLPGEERRYSWKYGDMFYKVQGNADAKPLLLIHGFGPGASSYEWRKNMDALAEQFRVYAVDLLGFGLSDHPAIDYTAETYTDLIYDFIQNVIKQPTIVVAHGLTCAYVIANAYRHPQLFERLVLVSPHPVILQETHARPLLPVRQTVFRVPIVGQFLYNMLTSRQAISGYYDEQGYHDLMFLTDDLVEYVYTCAHQPGSRYALASFLNDQLLLDVYEPFMYLRVPVVAVWGREGAISPQEASAAFLRVKPDIDVHIFNKCRFHLQDEQARAFNKLIRAFAATKVKE